MNERDENRELELGDESAHRIIAACVLLACIAFGTALAALFVAALR